MQDQREKIERDILEKDRRIRELISALTAAQQEKEGMKRHAERLLAE